MIREIGVELEGKWFNQPGEEIISDGSLEFYDDCELCDAHSCNCANECECPCRCDYGCECEQICRCSEGCICDAKKCRCDAICECTNEDYCQCYNGCECDYEDRCQCYDHCECENDCECVIGEIPLPPFSHKENFEDLKEAIKRNFPESVNSSCGTHVHLSFDDNLDYMNLMTEDFYEFFIKKMEIYDKEHFGSNTLFHERLIGLNSMCQSGFNADAQCITDEGYDASRYYHLNFAYRKHNTLENRLFPAFEDPDDLIQAIEYYCNFVNEYLEKFNKKEEKAIKIVLEVTD